MLNIPGSPDPNNPELVTLAQARAIAACLGSIAGGVATIFIPPYSLFSAPSDGDFLFYHFSFVNGASGFNTGLIWQSMLSFPYTWPAMLATSVNYQVAPQNAIPIPPALNVVLPTAVPPAPTVWPSVLPASWTMGIFGPSGPGNAPANTGTPGVNPVQSTLIPINSIEAKHS